MNREKRLEKALRIASHDAASTGDCPFSLGLIDNEECKGCHADKDFYECWFTYYMGKAREPNA